jgi:hypothetical protein
MEVELYGNAITMNCYCSSPVLVPFLVINLYGVFAGKASLIFLHTYFQKGKIDQNKKVWF